MKPYLLIFVFFALVAHGFVFRLATRPTDPPPAYFSVNMYGAIPNDGLDDGTAIRSAVAAAVSNGNAVVQFGAGTYHIGPMPGTNYAIIVNNATNILFNGWGSTNTTLVITDPQTGGIRVAHSKEVAVQNMAFDYDPLPFTQGTITAVGTNYFDIQLDTGYLDLSDPIFSNADMKWGIKVVPHQIYGPIAVFASAWTNISGQTWRMYPDDLVVFKRADLNVNDRYVHLARSWTVQNILFKNNADSRLEQVNMYASCGGPVTFWLGETNAFVNFYTVKIPTGSSRLISANGGAILSQGCRGGMLIQNCYFKQMPDDGINIHGKGSVVVKRFSDTKLRVGVPGGEFQDDLYKIGDEVIVYDKQNGGSRGTSTITSVAQVSAHAFDLTFNPAITGVVADVAWKVGDKLCNLSACGQGSIVKFCIVEHNRGRGVVLRSHDVQMHGCTFVNTEGWALGILHDYDYGEGPATYNAHIYDNTFTGQGDFWQPSIAIRSSLFANIPSSTYDIHDVLIENNGFIDIRNEAVLMSSCEDVFMSSNVVNVAAGVRTSSSSTIKLEECRGIGIYDTTITDPNTNMYAAVDIAATVALGTNGVYIQNLITDIAPSSIDIQDDR
ncbi:MAG: hypothetical protein K9L89_02310 [Kiritimatiellales bacterium]|nr:hypothetical protein [Kiritimatiellales bacterium]